MEMLQPQDYEKMLDVIRKKADYPIQAGIVLGSGLGELAEQIEKAVEIPYEELPGFPQSTVKGHHGRFVCGFLNDTAVAVMQGRVHFYEGHAASKLTAGIRVMAKLGIGHVILTNAAGAVNTGFKPGDLMVIDDHINLIGSNPLIGKHFDDWGERFVDMSETYDSKLRKILHQKAEARLIDIKHGIYAALSGPSYETPAEIHMLNIIGADAVGMSTVPEAIVARQEGIKTAGISVISNMGAGLLDEAIDHHQVVDIVKSRYPDLQYLLKELLNQIDQESV